MTYFLSDELSWISTEEARGECIQVGGSNVNRRRNIFLIKE